MGLLAAALILLISAPPQGSSVVLLPTTTPSNLTVHILGEVNSPGLYSLNPGSRMADAVAAAGGATTQAQIDSVNLAARVTDGQQIYIPSVNDPMPAPTNLKMTESEIDAELIDINQATEEQLLQLPGIGPTRARDIIQYRQENGPFDKIEDIQNVPGIGQTTFENLKGRIKVSP